jgi:hypothetical protein
MEGRKSKMITEVEKAWLAGFLDADGMIRLRIGRKNKATWKGIGPKSLVPLVTYTNTCVQTGEKLSSLIGQSFTDFAVTVSKSKIVKAKNWRPKITLEIGGIKRVEPFLRMVRPYLITKAGEADLLLRFCEIRNDRGRAAYQATEYRIFVALQHLKQTRHLRDYTPSIEQLLDDDIVRTNAKALEVAEMATRQTIEEGKEWAKNLVSKYRWKKSGQESNS